jgi:hypothetical protein
MRSWLLSLLMLLAPQAIVHAPAQQPKPRPSPISAAQKATMRKTLLARMDKDGWCTKGDDDDFADDLEFVDVPLSNHPVVLVSPGAGCARGGQGANSALWIFDLRTSHPRLIASPEQKVGGWWDGALPHLSYGFHDFNLGWHMSASEYTLTTFRFDGQAYRLIHSKTIKRDAD